MALVVLVLAALSARTADAATAFALTAANQIVTFDTSVPGAALSAVAITGLQGGETPLAIDLRPATGQLYLLGSTSRLYVLNPVTGDRGGGRTGLHAGPVGHELRLRLQPRRSIASAWSATPGRTCG